jgi:nitrite reductase (NO-forming)
MEAAPMSFAPDVPPPITRKTPRRLRVDIHPEEKVLKIMAGTDKDTSFPFWTFNGSVPGPMIRARVGDTLEIHMDNSASMNKMSHTVDFHGIIGPGGAAPALMTTLDQLREGDFKLLYPGLYIYHCAASPVPWHVAHGMYGLLLVEPEEGLSKVDREFYVVQSEIYTKKPFGSEGLQEFDPEAAYNERPTYVVFNGAVGSMMGDRALKAKVGERIRVFFGNGGPNLVASWHIIGVVFEKLYNLGATNAPLENVQSAAVPAGGSAWAEFTLRVPGNYTFVDHSIFRIEKGALGILTAEGPEQPELYKKYPATEK